MIVGWKLRECPPGLFMFNGQLGLKTEYGALVAGKVTNWPDAYCLESGEFFWGGTKTHEERAELMVLPLDADLTFARALLGRMRDALKPFADCVEQIADTENDEEWAKFRLLIKDYREARRAVAAAEQVLA